MTSIYDVFSSTGSCSPEILVERQLFLDQSVVPVVVHTFANANAGEDGVVISVWVIFEFSHVSHQLKIKFFMSCGIS